MMVTRPLFLSLADAQREVLANARDCFAALGEAQARAAEYPGWMFWKRYPTGRNYLVHAYDRTGRGTMLGGETPENALRLEQFKQEQEEAKLRLKMAKERVSDHARFVKAARLNRFPRRAAAVLRAFNDEPGRKPVLLGAYALYAYELRLGQLFASALLDADSLSIALDTDDETSATPGEGSAPKRTTRTLAEILRSADRSFELGDDRQSAISGAGLKVEFLNLVDAALTARVNKLERSAPLLLNERSEPTPTRREMVFDQDGIPLEVTVPDPRLFAAHQQLLAEQPDLDPDARERHRYLGTAVSEALTASRPNLPSLESLPELPETARLAALLHHNVLAGKQGAHR